jgi:MoxR-like ATPase
VHIDDTVRNYIVRLVQATRTHADLALGASPRGSIALFKSAQAWAALHGRSFVLPDDIKDLAVTTLAHRLIIRPESALRNRTTEQVIENLLEQVELDIGEM